MKRFDIWRGILGVSAFVLLVWLSGICGPINKPWGESTDPKIDSLYAWNNRLNKAIADHNWNAIYDMYHYSEKPTPDCPLCLTPAEKREYFVAHSRGIFFWGRLRLKAISYELSGDTAETTNIIKTGIFFLPFYLKTDTSFHHWLYRDGGWVLLDWDRRNLPGQVTVSDKDFDSVKQAIIRDVMKADSLRRRK